MQRRSRQPSASESFNQMSSVNTQTTTTMPHIPVSSVAMHQACSLCASQNMLRHAQADTRSFAKDP